MTDPRPRQVIENEIKNAVQEVEIARHDLYRAEDDLEELEAELAALPPENVDEELWYACLDPRQLQLGLCSDAATGRRGRLTMSAPALYNSALDRDPID